MPQTWRLDVRRSELWDFMLGSTVRTGALLRAQTPQALEAIRAEVMAASSNELPMPAVLSSATKGSFMKKIALAPVARRRQPALSRRTIRTGRSA